MSALDDALVSICSNLEEMGVPYAVIGGIAVGFWAQPRLTQDVDVAVELDGLDSSAVMAELLERFNPAAPNTDELLEQTRVLLLRTPEGVRVDVVIAEFPLQKRAVERAQVVQIGNARVRVCSPEDLILLKIISDRGKDQQDAEELTTRLWQSLDSDYLERSLIELCSEYEEGSIMDRWQSMKTEARKCHSDPGEE